MSDKSLVTQRAEVEPPPGLQLRHSRRGSLREQDDSRSSRTSLREQSPRHSQVPATRHAAYKSRIDTQSKHHRQKTRTWRCTLGCWQVQLADMPAPLLTSMRTCASQLLARALSRHPTDFNPPDGFGAGAAGSEAAPARWLGSSVPPRPPSRGNAGENINIDVDFQDNPTP